jgi:hypothetical protein
MKSEDTGERDPRLRPLRITSPFLRTQHGPRSASNRSRYGERYIQSLQFAKTQNVSQGRCSRWRLDRVFSHGRVDQSATGNCAHCLSAHESCMFGATSTPPTVRYSVRTALGALRHAQTSMQQETMLAIRNSASNPFRGWRGSDWAVTDDGRGASHRDAGSARRRTGVTYSLRR